MDIVLNSDPILSKGDAQTVLDFTTPDELTIVVNSVSARARTWMNRVQLNSDTDTAVVEKVEPFGGSVIYLHAPILDPATYDIVVSVVEMGTEIEEYKYSDAELSYFTDDRSSHILLTSGVFPDEGFAGYILITYYGGWTTIPGDVVSGAIMQARVEAARLEGRNVGVTSHSREGESVGLDSSGLIKTVRDLWEPYGIWV